MNLNKQQQQQWQMVTAIFGGLAAAITDEEMLATHMKPHIDTFEALTGGKAKVKFHLVPTPGIDWIDCSSDGLKLSSTTKGMVARACMNGLRLSINLAYDGAYAHSNAAVIDALDTLKANLLKLTSDMKDMEPGDISKLIGLAPSESIGQDDDAGVGGGAAGEDGLTPNVLVPGNIAGVVVEPELVIEPVVPAVTPEVATSVVAEEGSESLMSFVSDNSEPPEEVDQQ